MNLPENFRYRLDIIFRTVEKPRLAREDKSSLLSVLARILRYKSLKAR